MPFSFSAICDLLQTLELDHKRKQKKQKERGSTVIVNEWFNRHKASLASSTVDRVAVLSTLLPERRTDRVFQIQQKRLEAIVAKASFLGATRRETLRRWETDPRAGLDLAECVEQVLTETPNGAARDFSVEEIDDLLHQLAAGVAFSSPAVRASRRPMTTTMTKEQLDARGEGHRLDGTLRRLSARDAKWFCRLVLKSFLPVIVPEWLVYKRCDPLLPSVLKIHDNFAIAVALLDKDLRSRHASLGGADLLRLVKPQVGVKVGRQHWQRARSIKHCLQMGQGRMSCEKKMDGEYCQIHVDLSKGYNCIQIFSKSGKDSTKDREKLHSAIRSSLALGSTSCKFKKQCILEGELVVWSELEKKVMGFEKIRKHVNRSGRFFGISEDSQAHSWERLMIVYFDVLLIDDESMLNLPHSERRRRLSGLVHCQEGRAALVESQAIDFSSPLADVELRAAFAASIKNREEGLVLKPDEPYFNFGAAERSYASHCLKLKKGYIKKLGDVGDFAVVGARYDATAAKVLGNPKIKYTHFYLGCITNKEAATRFDAKPEFIVVNEVELNAEMAEQFRLWVWTRSVPLEENDTLELDLGIMQSKRMTTVFCEPAVFDVTSFSFHKEANTRFWSLRFPYVSKIHSDRSWRDCVSFDELQELAQADTTCPEQEDSQELATWIKALEDAEPKSRQRVRYHSETTDDADDFSAHSTESFSSNGDSLPSSAVPAIANAGAASLPTPFTSSAPQSPPGHNETPEPTPRKRQRRASQTPPRRSRQKTDVIELTSSPPAASQRSQQQEARAALEDITSAPSSQGNALPPLAVTHLARADSFHEEPNLSKPIQPPTSHLAVSASFHTPTPFSSPQKTKLATPTPSPSSSNSKNNNHQPTQCRHAGAACALANHAILLAPCVAHIPWLTEDLLPAHGAVAVYTDVAEWQQAPAAMSRTVLVEGRRSEATRAFLARLQAERTVVAGRRRAKVAIAYDWRLLEAITEEEAKRGGREGKARGAVARELWRKHYVGMC